MSEEKRKNVETGSGEPITGYSRGRKTDPPPAPVGL